MSEKIQSSHIEREACVYIRQSTMQQVRTRERAQALGFRRVVVIDEDLGRAARFDAGELSGERVLRTRLKSLPRRDSLLNGWQRQADHGMHSGDQSGDDS
jgi:hypothetical protein